jgi:hypothetical protein
LPIEIAPGETRIITSFYPLTPSPSRIEVRYTIAGSASVLVLGVADVLKGLHIAEPVDEVGTVADNQPL